MSAADATPVDDDPERWPKIVDTLQGQGPTPPAIPSAKRLSVIEARLESFGWQVRRCSVGGYFAWCPTATRYCATPRELGAFASKLKYAASVAARQAKADARKAADPTPVKSRSEQSNAARDRRVAMKAAFMDCLARVLARTTAHQQDGDGQPIGRPR